MAQDIRVLASEHPDVPLTLPEAAAFLKCGKRTVQRLVKAQKLTVLRVGRCPRFMRADLLKAIRPPSAVGAP
jgi:excisionase family DNA binding protein